MLKNIIRHYKITFVFLSALCMCSCSYMRRSIHNSANGMYFDTLVTIDIYDNDDARSKALLDECMNMCEQYENMFSKNIETSDIAKINSSNKPVKVSKDTINLLNSALKYCALSNGRFDITVDPVSSLWDFHDENNNIPEKNALADAVKHVNYKNIVINESENTVTLTDAGSSIDIGGAAKGYIADRIAERLTDAGINGAIINMGGDMRIIGTKDSNPFTVGIADPSKNTECIISLNLTDRSVATSGTYERYIKYNGVTYHHILDPKTGYSVDTDIVSATVICPNAIDADCLATVSLLLGSNNALKLIEELHDTEAIFVLSNNTVVKSSGAASYIRN